jgi:hypothetical protein
MSLVEILMNCPKGMKLYSPIYGEVEFTEISAITENIGCKINGCTVYFYSDGTYFKGGECMLFPSKELRDWNDFMIPFKDGDVIIKTEFNPSCKQYNIAIFSNYNANFINRMTVHCQVNGANEFKTRMCICHKDWRLANAEEIQRFTTRMHESGYDFKNGKLIPLPIFKIGDTITNGTYTFKISHIDDLFYYEDAGVTVSSLRIQEQDNWRIKKFDIRSLKPYDKVLVKNGEGCWYPSLISYVDSSGDVYIIDSSDSANYVIPFEGNEHLIGGFSDPDPYYITWNENIC